MQVMQQTSEEKKADLYLPTSTLVRDLETESELPARLKRRLLQHGYHTKTATAWNVASGPMPLVGIVLTRDYPRAIDLILSEVKGIRWSDSSKGHINRLLANYGLPPMLPASQVSRVITQ